LSSLSKTNWSKVLQENPSSLISTALLVLNYLNKLPLLKFHIRSCPLKEAVISLLSECSKAAHEYFICLSGSLKVKISFPVFTHYVLINPCSSMVIRRSKVELKRMDMTKPLWLVLVPSFSDFRYHTLSLLLPSISLSDMFSFRSKIIVVKRF